MFMNDKEIQAIADKLGVTVGQVILSWGVQRGTVVIPKSEKEERMIANITVYFHFRSHHPVKHADGKRTAR